jgi:hypothetical protein
MRPIVAVISKRFDDTGMYISTEWPKRPFSIAENKQLIHFEQSMSTIAQRFAAHPFRTYHFGVWHTHNHICGLVVFRYVKVGGMPAVALLAAYADDLESLLASWVTAVSRQGIRLIHLLATPNSRVLAALRKTAVCLPSPVNRNPYYLTAKPLTPDTPETIFDFNQWDCIGGDIL